MICPKCSAVNDESRWRCRSCFSVLRKPGESLSKAVSIRAPEALVSAQATPAADGQNEETAEAPRPTLKQPGAEYIDIPAEHHDISPEKEEPEFQTSRQGLWIIGVIFSLFLLVGAAIFYFSSQPQYSAASNAFFAQAERQYNEQKFAESLLLFEDFLQTYPDHDLAGLAREKIIDLQLKIKAADRAFTERQRQVDNLVGLAQEAMSRKRFTRPADDNVVAYTTEVLSLDPRQPQALDMRQQVVDYFLGLADRARKRGRKRSASRHYNTVLTIDPFDATALAYLGRDAPGNTRVAAVSRSSVDEARRAMGQARQKALDAGLSAERVFLLAADRALQADNALRQTDLVEAKRQYDGATFLFQKSLQHGLRDKANEAIAAQNEMKNSQAEAERVLAHIFAKEIYDAGRARARVADQSLARQDYIRAIKEYGSAGELLDEAIILTQAQRKKN